MNESADRFAAAVADRYRLERELGQGGMATVYLAHDIRHDRKVAIKVLREDLAASMGAGRFLREIQIAAQLQHPNILPLLDSGDTAGFLYYVMPFVTGQSLRERLAREGELPVHEAVRLLVEVVDALSQAHQHGVVHRDIKPDNVMLSGRHALVADFGVAKAISEATGRNTVTTLGVAVGTPAYMSPEQAAADPHIDHRSDIYSVGVMAYEMLTGRPPFTGTTPQQVLAAHVTEAPDAVSKRRPAISGALDQCIMRCLAKRPADRYQTSDELLQQLEALATPSTGITPTQTRPVTAWSEPAARRRWIIPAVVAAAVVIAGAAYWMQRPSAPAPAVNVPRVQATSTGTLQSGAISPDGQRVAYSERECDDQFRCTVSLIIQDIGGVGRLTAASGIAGIYTIDWSPDARRVVYMGTSADGRFGMFVVPSLGGEEPRFLGHDDVRFFGRGDSIIAAHAGAGVYFVAKDALNQGGRDTVVFRPLPVRGSWGVSPDGKFIAVAATVASGARYLKLMDRRGATVDSLPISHATELVGFSPRSSLVLEVRDTTNPDLAEVIEHGLQPSGRVARTARTLLPSQAMFGIRVSASGISYLAGDLAQTLYEGSRPSEFSADIAVREATTTTGNLGSLLSGDGASIVLTRRSQGGGGVMQVSLLPFGGGAERPLGTGFRGVADWSRTVAADAMVFVHRDDDRARITRFDLATGQTTALGFMRDTMPMEGMEVLQDGSIAWHNPDDTSGSIQVRAPSGEMRVISTPNVSPSLLEDSQFGDGILGWGWNRFSADSAIIFHVPPGASSGRRLLQLGVESVNGLRWATGGRVELIIGETTHTSAVYRFDPATSTMTRMGTIPLLDVISVSFSLDGRRMSLRTNVPRRDIWLAKVFD